MSVSVSITVEGRTFKYDGQVNKDGHPNGNGRVVGPDGYIYEGMFSSVGPQCYIAENGTTYDRNNNLLEQYHNNILYFGKYWAIFFSGDFLHGKRHGWGISIFTQGLTKYVYEGEYNDDMMCGTFLFTDDHGKRFEYVYANNVRTSEKPASPQFLAAHTASRAAAEQRRAQLKAQPTDVKQQGSELEEQKKLVAQLRAENTQQKNQISQYLGSITQHQAETSQLRTENGAKTNEITKLQADAKAKIQELTDKTATISKLTNDLQLLQNTITQLQQMNKQQTTKMTNTEQEATKKQQELNASNELISNLQELVRTRNNEFSVQVEAQLKEIASLKQQAVFDTNKHQQALVLLEQQCNEKVQNIKTAAEQYVQQQRQQVGFQNNQQGQQMQELQQQLNVAQQLLQQKDLINEVDKMKGQMNLKDEIQKQTNNVVQLKDEIAKYKDEIANQKDLVNKLEKELTKSKSSQQSLVCRKCGAVFLGQEDLTDHEKHCKKIPCPLCDVKPRSLDEFFVHVETHKKRDNVVSE